MNIDKIFQPIVVMKDAIEKDIVEDEMISI